MFQVLFTTLKQHYVEIGILCDVAPPTVYKCKTTVVNTNPRSFYKLNLLRHIC